VRQNSLIFWADSYDAIAIAKSPRSTADELLH
jgi:hypothetical protein